jgi:hypothetical protein
VTVIDDVLAACAAAGIQLRAEGDRLRARAPVGGLTPDLRTALQAHRGALLALLAERRPALWWEREPWHGQISPDEHRAIVAAYIAAHSRYTPDLPLREPAVLRAWLAAREPSR